MITYLVTPTLRILEFIFLKWTFSKIVVIVILASCLMLASANIGQQKHAEFY